MHRSNSGRIYSETPGAFNTPLEMPTSSLRQVLQYSLPPFQYSIGDARLGISEESARKRLRLSILHWRCTRRSPRRGGRVSWIRFQYSIGDASRCVARWRSLTRPETFQYSIGDAGYDADITDSEYTIEFFQYSIGDATTDKSLQAH